MGKFEIYTDAAWEYRFRLKAWNGQNILASQGYSSKSACENGIESVRENCKIEERFEISESESGKFYFHIKAANHQIIGSSQMYTSRDGAENGIHSVRENAPDAEVTEED